MINWRHDNSITGFHGGGGQPQGDSSMRGFDIEHKLAGVKRVDLVQNFVQNSTHHLAHERGPLRGSCFTEQKNGKLDTSQRNTRPRGQYQDWEAKQNQHEVDRWRNGISKFGDFNHKILVSNIHQATSIHDLHALFSNWGRCTVRVTSVGSTGNGKSDDIKPQTSWWAIICYANEIDRNLAFKNQKWLSIGSKIENRLKIEIINDNPRKYPWSSAHFHQKNGGESPSSSPLTLCYQLCGAILLVLLMCASVAILGTTIEH